MDIIYEIRRRHLAQRQTITEIAKDMGLSRPSVRKHLLTVDEPKYMLRASSTCLVLVDRNRYSVPAAYAGQAVSVRISANQVCIVANGEVIAAHARAFGRDQLVCDPWHYLPVLEKKPGAIRDGAPFVAWDLPSPIITVRDRILKQPKGDRAFVELLMLAGEAGLEALTVACELALESGVINAPVIMNALRRLISPHMPITLIAVPDGIALTMEPIANCHRYDYLLGVGNVH